MSFSSDIKRYTDEYRRKMSFVAKDATQRTLTDASIPVAKGGRMPVDTNFLRSSLVSNIGGMPSGEARKPPGFAGGSTNEPLPGDNVTAQLIRWNPATETFYAGWPPIYARAMEYKYGFLRGAVERWPEFVRRAVNAADRGLS